MTALRIGSFCTGYGGLDAAVQQVLGGQVVWHADNDPAASQLLAHHWPGTPNLGDITAVDWHQVEPVDVLTGGYPCQPFSLAGHRKGTDDDRHIWPHIATALGVLRPRVVVLENVAGHISLGFADVLADLARLGFDAEWATLRASEVGAAHARNRLFVVAWPADATSEGRVRARVPGPTPERRRAPADTDSLGGHGNGTCGGRRDEPAAHGQPAAHPARDGHGHPRPTCERGLPAAAVAGGAAAPSDALGVGRSEGRPEPARFVGRPDAVVDSPPDWGRFAPAVDRWAAVLGRPAPRPVDDRGRLSPDLVEWLMGLPAGHVTAVPGLTRTAQLRLLGNGVVVQQAAHALRLLLDRAPEALAALPALDPARSQR